MEQNDMHLGDMESAIVRRPPTQLNKNMDQNEMHLPDIESTIVEERLSTLPAQNEMRDIESAIVEERLSTLPAQNEMRDIESAIVEDRLSTLPAQNEMRDIESAIVEDRLSTLPAQNEMRDIESAIVEERLSTLPAQNEMRDIESAIVEDRLSTLPAQNEMRDIESAIVEDRLSTLPAQNEMRDVESAIVRSVEERLSTLPDQFAAATIFKVPHTITSGQPKAYKPNFVSIGPFHHYRNFPDGHQTKAAETHKIRYLRDFLRRADQPCKFKDYVSGILPLERKTRNCYSEEVQLSCQELVEGMVFDACFIIELFLKFDKKDSIDKDPICESRLIFDIAYDLLLLENQLPFFILEDVYNRFNQKKSSFKPFTELAENFFRYFGVVNAAKLRDESVEVHHLLHLVYLHFEIDLPRFTPKFNLHCGCNVIPFQLRSRSSNEAHLLTHRVIIPSATQLHDAGVKLSKGKNTNCLAIEFNNGRLKIPPFFLDKSVMILMRNLVAFEQCSPLTKCKYWFTSYALFMDRLVNTDKDIEILSEIGIIVHKLGSDEEAAVFFNKLGSELRIDYVKTHLGEICEQLNKYYRCRPHVWRAKLMHDYFSNPWSMLSLVAALVLLVLTFIQTVFSVKS